jgi:hypothetical protein
MANTSNRTYVVRSGAAANTSVAVALVAATAKTVVGVFGTSGTTIALYRWRVSFASVTATDVPALVEVGITTAAGTVGTSYTPAQVTGSTLASACAAGYNYSGEPTYNRILESLYVPVNNGVFEYTYSLGFEPQCDPSQGLAIRITAPQAQNCHANLFYIE